MYEPILLLNGASQLAAAIFSFLLASKIRKEHGCMLMKPFYFLSGSLFLLSMLNMLWFFGVISISEVDNLLIGPFFHLAFLAVWFYVCLFTSSHDHIYYFIPIFIMSVNAFLLLEDLALVCDIITGLVIIGVFFYLGFIDHHHVKKISFAGMLYGLALIAASALSSLMGWQYLHSVWFVPNLVLVYILLRMLHKGHICDATVVEKRHIPMAVEVFKFGLFMIGLSMLLMLGILGVHEFGHSITAKAFGCSHKTEFDIGFAVTQVVCDSAAGTTLIVLGGLALTLVISLLMYFLGNDFAKRASFILLAFSLLTAIDDFRVLGLPYSLMAVIALVSVMLIVYWIFLVVQNYLLEYESYEASICRHMACGKEMHLNIK